jgi:hypothetical protein
MKVGKRIFYKGEPVIYFDTLKTSTLEGAATTVYAQGGRGNARLMSWDGERTVTFTMEDALISPEGLSILTGAGLVEAEQSKPIYVHTTERISGASGKVTWDSAKGLQITMEESPAYGTDIHDNADVYVLVYDAQNNLYCEPFSTDTTTESGKVSVSENVLTIAKMSSDITPPARLKDYVFLVDFYTKKESGAMQINITPDKFGGAFYIEASTLFRDQATQLDMPAEFIIPNARVQSNFTFTLAGSGDPSSFTFTMDAFPDYTRFDADEKVLASIQIVGGAAQEAMDREATNTKRIEDEQGVIVNPSLGA